VTALRLVIKIGGEVLSGPEGGAIAAGIRALVDAGHNPVLVHGGGPQATALQRALGQEPRLVAGRRITDAATLEVMKYVVAGKVNVDLCGLLLAHGVRSIGLHGASGHMVQAKKRPPRPITGAGPEPVDMGFVGDITGYNLELLASLQNMGLVPVIACLGCDDQGQALNINGDTVASQLAGALQADALVLVTSTPGVLADVANPNTRIPAMTRSAFEEGVASGTIAGGMIPKLEESFAVLEGGARSVVIVGRLGPGDLEQAVLHPGSVGTVLKP
jgi:acetylglutamate kinase